MSYSYIKSVFPNFETSKVYDQNMFNSLYQSKNKTSTVGLPSAYDEEDINKFAKELINDNKDSNAGIEPTQTILETYDNIHSDYKPLKVLNRDNLKYYNLAAPQEYISNNKNIINENRYNGNKNGEVRINRGSVEHFQDKLPNIEVTTDCNKYLKHTLECSKCKSILIKQFNLESDRIRNEEIMELISYLIFGLFVLLLLDNLTKK